MEDMSVLWPPWEMREVMEGCSCWDGRLLKECWCLSMEWTVESLERLMEGTWRGKTSWLEVVVQQHGRWLTEMQWKNGQEGGKAMTQDKG